MPWKAHSKKEFRSCWHFQGPAAEDLQSGVRPLVYIKAKEKKVLDCELVHKSRQARCATIPIFVH